MCLLQLAGWAFAVTAIGYVAVTCLAWLSAIKANAAAKNVAAAPPTGLQQR